MRSDRSARCPPAACAAALILALGASTPVLSAVAPKVAIIKSSSIPQFERATEAILEAMRRHPLQPEMLTFDLEGESANGGAVIRQAHDAGPQVIITVGSLATTAALKHPSPVPVIFSMVLYPRQSGFLGAADRPVTGASLDIPIDLQFRHIRRLLPSARRIGVLYHPAETGAIVEEARPAAAAQSLDLIAEPVTDPAQAVTVFEKLIERVDVVWTVADSHVFSQQTTPALLLAALRRGIPIIGLSSSHVRAGALAAFNCDYADVGRQTAELTLRVLGGEAPERIPPVPPRMVSLALNLRTAAHMGIRVDPSVEAEAQEVIR